MISTPLRMEKPVSSPIVPPIRPNCASVVTFIMSVESKTYYQKSSSCLFQTHRGYLRAFSPTAPQEIEAQKRQNFGSLEYIGSKGRSPEKKTVVRYGIFGTFPRSAFLVQDANNLNYKLF